jgi:hypothetical protein
VESEAVVVAVSVSVVSSAAPFSILIKRPEEHLKRMIDERGLGFASS